MYVIDQINQTITDGSSVSLVFSGQEDARTSVPCGGHIMGFRCIVRHRAYLRKKCEKLLKFLRLFLESLLMYFGPLGCQGQYCEQLRKGNMFPSFAVVGVHLHPGRRTDQAECLPSEACLCSKANSGLFAYESTQEFIIWPSILFVCIHNLEFIEEILAAALYLCAVWEQCRDENGLSNCKKFHTKPQDWKSLSLVREWSLAFHKSSAVLNMLVGDLYHWQINYVKEHSRSNAGSKMLCNAFLPNKLEREGPGGWEVERRSQAQLSYDLSVVPDSSL